MLLVPLLLPDQGAQNQDVYCRDSIHSEIFCAKFIFSKQWTMDNLPITIRTFTLGCISGHSPVRFGQTAVITIIATIQIVVLSITYHIMDKHEVTSTKRLKGDNLIDLP